MDSRGRSELAKTARSVRSSLGALNIPRPTVFAPGIFPTHSDGLLEGGQERAIGWLPQSSDQPVPNSDFHIPWKKAARYVFGTEIPLQISTYGPCLCVDHRWI